MKNETSYSLSVIIVNYNVAYFLEQCLSSVYNSRGIEKIEVIVVDNRSSDGSIAMINAKFPQVKLLANTANVGFSKANNQGIAIAQGEYVVLLNPDTVVEESTFEEVINAFNEDPRIGGIGVRMVDGKGTFLPESKRGLPTPKVAFYKVFGLSKLFPKSKRFGRYHLSYLDEFENHEVDVLSGAFMGLRVSVLKEIGGLDEDFFMYGEDIDLSYRIQKAGYKNLYLAKTTIIHYKGESTKKSSVNYVFVFYRAMIIFAKKHFSQNNAFIFSVLIHLGIYVRASAALLKRSFTWIMPLIWNSGIGIAGLYLLTGLWKSNAISFPNHILLFMIPFYWFMWTFSSLLFGTYDPPFQVSKLLKGTFVGTLVILVIYALLPKDFQFSRLYILLGSLWFTLWNLLDKLLRFLLLRQNSGWNPFRKKRFLIVGNEDEFKRIKNLLLQHTNDVEYIHGTAIKESYLEARMDLSTFENGSKLGMYDEIIFSAKDLSASQIIHFMSSIKFGHLDFKIAQPETDFIIGSNSIETSGETYRLNINNLNKPQNLRSKRFLDVVFSILLLLTFPLHFWFYRNRMALFMNILKVISGKKTWVGFIESNADFQDPQLPRLLQGILNPGTNSERLSDGVKDKLNLIYARDYSVLVDIKILLYNLNKLDQESA